MKKCPACNRTYADETLSFCLEDGSLLSASYDLRQEQETIVSNNKAQPPPTEFFRPVPEEIPTIASARSAVPVNASPPTAKKNLNTTILFALGAGFLVAAIYTMSIIPLVAGAAVVLIYLFLRLLIRSLK